MRECTVSKLNFPGALEEKIDRIAGDFDSSIRTKIFIAGMLNTEEFRNNFIKSLGKKEREKVANLLGHNPSTGDVTLDLLDKIDKAIFTRVVKKLFKDKSRNVSLYTKKDEIDRKGFSSGEALQLAEIEHGRIIKRIYDENSKLPVERRLSTDQIIRKAAAEITNIFYRDNINTLIESNIENILKELGASEQSLFGDLQTLIDKLKEVKDNPKYSALYQYLTIDERLKEIRDKFVNERDDAVAEKLKDEFKALNNQKFIYAQNIVNVLAKDNTRTNTIIRNWSNLAQLARTNDAEWNKLVTTHPSFFTLAKVFNKGFERLEELNEEEFENSVDDEGYDRDTMMRNYGEKEVRSFKSYFSDELKEYLSTIPKLREYWDLTSPEAKFDRDNELGVQTYYKREFVMQQLLSFANTNSMNEFITSIEAKAKAVPELYGLSKIARDIRSNRVLRNALFRSCATFNITKAMVFVKNSNYGVSNRSNQNRTIIHYNLNNQFNQTYTQPVSDEFKKVAEAISKYKVDTFVNGESELVDALLESYCRYFPNIDVKSIENYLNSSTNNNVKVNRIKKLGQNLVNLINLADSINIYREAQVGLYNKARAAYAKYQHERNEHELNPLLYDAPNTDKLSFYGIKISEIDGKEVAEKPAYSDFVDQHKINSMLADSDKIIAELANIIDIHGISSAEHNSSNAEANMSSDLIKPNYVTRFFEMINYNPSDDTPLEKNEALLALKDKITKGDKNSNQYTYHPILFGFDVGGVHVPGIFKRVGNEIVIDSRAKEILQLQYFNGVTNPDNNVAQLYSKLGINDYFITSFIAYSSSISHQDQNGKYTSQVEYNGESYNRAQYFLRTPSDKPNNLTIGYFSLNRRQCLASITMNVKQELCDFVTQLGNILEKDGDNYYIKENGSSTKGLFARQHFEETPEGAKFVDDNGKLAGNFFKFHKLFNVNGYDANAELMDKLSLYGEGLIVKESNGRYKLNRNFIGNLLTLNESDSIIRTSFINNPAIDSIISDIVSEWSKNFFIDVFTNHEDMIASLSNVSDIEINDTIIEDFLLNYANMNMNYDMLFEGNVGFYKGTRDFLKRTKEVQAGGLSYAGFSTTDRNFEGLKEINDINGQPEVIEIRTKKDGKISTYSVPTNNGNFVGSKPITARNGFRAVTVNNVIRKSSRISDLTNQMKEIYKSQGIDDYTAEHLAKQALQGLNPKKGTTVDDAQSYITFEEWIRRRYADGTLDQYQDLIGMLLDPNVKVEDLDLAAINARIQVDKNFYYDMMYDDNTRTYYPRQIKNAEFVLIPKLLPEGSELRKVYDIMRANDIGQLNTAETSKAAKKNVIQLWNEDGSIVDTFENEVSDAAEVYYYRYLYKQQDNPEHIRDKENKAGIQIMSKILDNSNLDNDVIKNAVKKFFNNYTENIHQAFVEFIDSCGWEVKNGVIVNKLNGSSKLDYSRFIMAARQEAARLGLNTEQLKYFDIDETGNFRLPIGMNILGDKIENTLMSLINSNITRQTLPGFHGVQITNVGYDETLQYHPRAYLKDGKYINKEKYDKLEDKTGWEETNAPYIEVRLPRWSDKIPKHSENLSDDEILEMLEKEGLDQMIIYRIPTEGKQSVAVAKVVGFVEEAYGSTIVVPDEWVTQTGSDFDTDSIYGITYEMYTDGNNKPRRIRGIKNDATEEDLKHAYVRYVNSKLEHRINRAQYTDGELEKQLKRQYKEVKDKLADTGDTFKEINDIVFDLEGILPGKYKAVLKENRAIAKDITETKLDKLLTSISLIHGEIEELLEKEKDEPTKVLVQTYLTRLEELNGVLTSQTELIKQKSDISSKIEELKQKREALFTSQFESVEKAAKVIGLPTFEEYKGLSREEQNTTKARNNEILDAMIEIMSSPLSLEENLSTSNFVDLSEANKKCKEILGLEDAKLSPYNPIDQMLQHGDAMGGADLKGISVNFDSLCSLCNFAKAELTSDKLELPEYEGYYEVLENIGVEVVYPKDYDKDVILAAYPNAKVDENGNIIVFHDQVGHSENNKNVVGKYITVYSSETTAHALDAIKEGSILNLDPYNFPEYKLLSMIGIDYDTILSFLYQPAISKVMEIKRANDSIYNQSSTNPIQQAIIQLIKARYPDNLEIQHSYSFFSILSKIGIDKKDLANYKIQLNPEKQFERLSRPGDITARFTAHYNRHLLIGQGGYSEITKINADWSDITLALASNFGTGGEILTARYAGATLVDTGRLSNRGTKIQKITNDGGKYVSNVININNPEATANDLYTRILNQGLPTKDIKLNIAGNGIYTLRNYGFTQSQINNYVTEVIRLLQEKGITIKEIRTGGESGIDEAGIIAAQRLGLEYSILMPEDYSYKNEKRETIRGRAASIERFKLYEGEMDEQVEEDFDTDLDILLSFYKLHSMGSKVNSLLQKTKPDKFGAKQTMFETLETLDEIYDLIYPDLFPKVVTGLNKDINLFRNSILSIRRKEEDRSKINDTEINKSHISLLLGLYQYNLNDEYDVNEIKEFSKYPYKAAFLKYATMLSEKVVRPLLVYENEEFFDTFKNSVQIKLGREINKEEWKKLKRYTTTLAYSRIPQLTHPLSIDLTTGNIKIDLLKNEREEINRINGYISTNTDIELDSLDNPFADENSSEEDRKKYQEALETYYSYTPIQKVQFLQKTLRENRGIFEYINSILFSQIKYDRYGYSGAKMSFNDGDVNLEDLFVQFNEAYHSENPFIKAAALDLVKYVFLVEGQRFRRGNISKFITDDAISDENGLDITRNFNKVLYDILLNKNDQAIINFIRSNPTIARQVKISEKNREFGQWQINPAHSAWNQYCKKRGGIRLVFDTRDVQGSPVEGTTEARAMNKLLDRLNPHDGEMMYITEKEGKEYVSKLYFVKRINALNQWAFIPIPKLDSNEVWDYSYNRDNNEGYYTTEDYVAILSEYEEQGKSYSSEEDETVDQRFNKIGSIYNTIADDKQITTIPKIKSINVSNVESNVNYLEEELAKDEDKFLVGGIKELKRQIFDEKLGLLTENNLYGTLYVYNTNNKLKNLVSYTPSVQRLTYTNEFGEEKEVYVSIQLMEYPDRRNIVEPYSISQYDSITSAPIKNSTYKVKLLGIRNIENKTENVNTNQSEELEVGMSSGFIRPIMGNTYSKSVTLGFEESTAEMVTRLYQAAAKGDQKAKDLKILFFKARINTGSMDNMADNAKYIYERMSDYIAAVANELIDKSKNFELNGRIYSIDDEELYRNLGDFNDYLQFQKYNELVKLLLDITTFGSYLADLRDIPSNDELNRSIHKIRETINKVKTETKVKDAFENIFNIYFAKYSNNPLISEGVIQLREEFGDADWFDHWFADVSHLRNKEVQVVVKLVNSMLNEVNRYLAPKARRAFYKKYDDIMAMPGTCDFSKFIDEYNYLRHDYTKDFIDKKQELDDKVNDALNIHGRYSTEYMDAWIEREEFLIKNVNREIDTRYYQDTLDNIKEVYRSAPDLYFEYIKLSHELNDETLKFAEGTPEELERKRKIRYNISQLTNKYNVYTNTFKTPTELAAIEKLAKFLDRKREINEYYFNNDEVDNWEDNLNNYTAIVNAVDAANPDMTIAEKCAAFQDYNEAYNWIKINAHRKMTDEADEKINEAREILNGASDDAIAYKSTIRHYAHEHGQLDINNGIDARMFTDDEIRDIKAKQIAAFDRYVEDPSDLDREGIIVDERTLNQASQADIDFLKNIKPDIPTEAQEIRRRVYLELNKYLRPYFKPNGEFDDIKFIKELTTDKYLDIKNLLAELDNLPKLDDSHPQHDAWIAYWKAFYYDPDTNPDGIYEGKTDEALFNQKRARALRELSGQELTFWKGIFAYVTTEEVTGNRITSPNPVFFDYLEVAEPHVDARRTWAMITLNDNTESVGNEYFQDALKKARKEGREQEFLKLNTVYNRNTHKWELLQIWTTTELKPNNPLGGSYEYIPTFENRKTEVKPAFDNELRGVFHKEEVNYNTTTGEYNDNYMATLNDKEKAMRQLFINTMNEYLGINYKIDSAINSGILPRETLNPWNTQRVLDEAAQMVGFKMDKSYNEYSMEGQLSYVKDTTDNLNMMDIQRVKGFEIEEAIPPRNNGESMTDYYNRIKEIRKNNREKRQKNLDREKDLLNKDYRSVFGKFVTAATEARAREEIKGTIYLLLEELLGNEAYDINSKGKVTRNAARSTVDSTSYNKKKQFNTYDVVQNWAKRKLFADYQNKNVLRSAANVTQMFTSAKFMIGNIYSGIANVTTGYTNMTMELFSEDYFTRKDAMEAQVEYLSGTASYLGAFMNVAEQEKYATKQDAIIKLCQVIEYDRIFERAPGEKLSAYNERCRDALYGFQSMGEHLMQNTVLFALLKGTRIYYDPVTKTKKLVSEKQYSRHLEMEALRLVLDEVNPDFRTNFEEFIQTISNDKKLLRKYDNFSRDITQDWLKAALFNDNEAVSTDEAKTILDKFKEKRKELMASRKNDFYNLKRVYDQLDFVDGNIELIENDDNDSFDGRLLGELVERVIMLNKKIHGVYDKDGAARIEREWFGSLIMQYHKHIYPGCMKHWRFRGGYFNEMRGTIERGMYADGLRYLANILPFYDNFVKSRDNGASVVHSILNSAMHTILELPARIKVEAPTTPKHKIDNMKRIYGEGCAIILSGLAFLAIYSMYGGDDDDKEKLKNDVIASSALYLADRLISETIMYNGYGTVMEAKTLWNNPVAGGAFYIDVIDAASLLTEYMFGLNPDWEPVYQRGPHKGENKFAVLAKRNFWLTRIYNRINTIGQNNAYYRIGNKSIVSDIAKSIAWEDDNDEVANYDITTSNEE